jgi:ABC-type transport system involved in cytochrome c biogenesis permease subunit
MKALCLALLLCLGMLGFAPPAHAQKPDMQHFKVLPILHEGRIKPLGSFAQITLRQISGETHLAAMSAEEWLALSLFDPATAARLEIFRIGDEALLKKLGLQEEKKLYSLAELGPGLSQTLQEAVDLSAQENLTPAQTEFLTLHEHAALYTKILRSFSALLPLDLRLPERYASAAPQKQPHYLALQPLSKKLDADLKAIIAKKGTDPQTYTQEELKTAEAAFRLNQMREAGSSSAVLRVIPSLWHQEKTEWFSPWDLLQQGEGSPQSQGLIQNWKEAAHAYRSADPERWEKAIKTVSETTFAQAQNAADPLRLQTEIVYRALQPYSWAVAFYGLSFLVAVLLFNRTHPAAFLLPLCCTLIAMGLHGLSIFARIYILGRPPVGTLYESVLFVSLICGALGFLISLHKKNLFALMAGCAAAGFLLLIAPIALPNRDNLEVLVAVLNTNFWLATHVLCITAGYGLCILTACLSHFALALQDASQRLYKNIYQLSLAALLLMAVGTVLGGIWADQSWGRFWGWDPKENGALLICLWLIWVQHGRISGKLNTPAFYALLSALNIIVALSWFGVNLLNVGLHSYGFTSGMATGLSVFCAAQSLVIAVLWIRKIRRDKERAKNAA